MDDAVTERFDSVAALVAALDADASRFISVAIGDVRYTVVHHAWDADGKTSYWELEDERGNIIPRVDLINRK